MSDMRSHDSTAASRSAQTGHFGAYALPAWREAIRAFGAGLIPRHYPRLASIIGWPIWRLSLLGRPGPVDLEPYPGFRTRLYPRENHADTKCYSRPALIDWPEEVELAKCVASTAQPTFYCVDVGANTGTYSILMARLARDAKRKARLVCIEANPMTQERLAANLAFSGLVAQADLIRCAVSDKNGMVTLHRPAWNLGSAKVRDTAAKGPKRENSLTVRCRKLLDIIEGARLPRIDLLKIDIEGHEVPALRPFLSDAPRFMLPKTILAETKHDRDFQLSNLLIGAGYEPVLEGRSDTIFKLGALRQVADPHR